MKGFDKMKNYKLQNTPKRKTEIWCYIDEHCIELSKGKQFITLNPVESHFWEQCNGHITIADMISGFTEKGLNFDAISEVEEYAFNLLESWKNDGLLIMDFNFLHPASEYNESYIYKVEANVEPPVDILLISAPVGLPATHEAALQGTHMESLGINYLSSYLKSHGFSVGIMNLWVQHLNPNTIRDFISRYNPKIVGISAMTENFMNGVKISEIIKDFRSNIKIVYGGCHVTFEDVSTLLNHESIDIVARGEGEHIIHELANLFLNNIGKLSDIDGITYRVDSEIIRNKDRMLIQNLDSLPFPDRTALINHSQVAIGVQSSRGCPSKCIFCSARGLHGGKYRKRTAKNVVDEVESLINQGAKVIFFQDDTLTLDIKRLNEILDLIELRKLRFMWSAESRVDVIEKHPHILKRMRDAGCITLQFGIEAGSQTMLDALKKDISLEQIYNAVSLAVSEGISLKCSFLIGHPYETHDTILETVSFAKKLVDLGVAALMAIVCPYPGSDICARPEVYGIKIKHRDYLNYNVLSSILDTKHLTANEIKKYYYKYTIELDNHFKEKRKHMLQQVLQAVEFSS
jgi:radical SAM superfamily enzyme YgiQ (UPF0313 family)